MTHTAISVAINSESLCGLRIPSLRARPPGKQRVWAKYEVKALMVCRLVLCAIFLVSTPLASAVQADTVEVASPDGRIQMTIATLAAGAPSASGGQLAFRVSFSAKPVFAWSRMGLQLEGQPLIGAHARILSSRGTQSDSTWKPVVGKSALVRDHYNGAVVDVEETVPPGRKFQVEARLFNDGVAFRYHLPARSQSRPIRLKDEKTVFHFAKDATTYPLMLAGFNTSYEGNYVKLPLSAWNAHMLVGMPLLAELPGTAWVAITEAQTENYSGMYLARSSARELESRLSPRADDSSVAVVLSGGLQSPWRVAMIADHPGRFVESGIILNLNQPSAINDTSWIRAGKSAWNWWSGSHAEGGFRPGMNDDTMRYYIDFAARNGFEYMLIDAGWAVRPQGGGNAGADITRTIPEIDIPALVEYAARKNVRLWLWAHWTSVDKQMDEAFPLFEKWGIAGVKIDFMDRDDQWMVDWYRKVLIKAAQHRLMIDFHGAYKPDGLRRTFPNLMTREGILGLEYNRWSARDTPGHRVMLFFTRLLAGPADYTPGGFENVTREEFEPRNRRPMVMGTRAQHLALFVLYESPFLCVADWPGAYEGSEALDFIRAVPATWDETRFLSGHPESHAVVARRKGAEWFVGAITNWEPRTVDLPLQFLGKGDFTVEIYRDTPSSDRNPKLLEKEVQKVSSSTVLKFRLAGGGGAALRILPAR